MGKFLLFFSVLFLTLNLGAQKAGKDAKVLPASQRYVSGETPEIKLAIYPVPVSNNTFNIKTNKDISTVKVTNIIGQDIFKEKYNTHQQFITVTLHDPQRGMYLVTIIFTDGLRIVKKIMVEESK
ncbi:MAG TPA: T9SS type A sorting domain-containing protein [Bacteroidales bacterium]|nr:T9SS type A sorting domain-containing protein [Bacteroidales bacterium]